MQEVSQAMPPISQAPTMNTSTQPYLICAVGVAACIASLIATGCLFSQLGYPSLVIGGVGSLIGLAAVIHLACQQVPRPSAVAPEPQKAPVNLNLPPKPQQVLPQPTPKELEAKKQQAAWKKYLISVFQNTQDIFQKGSYEFEKADGSKMQVNLDAQAMLAGTQSYGDVAALAELTTPPHVTKFSVQNADTFKVLITKQQEGKNPVGVNLANRLQAGGGVGEGCTAQEESLSRRSNLVQSLTSQHYPLSEYGGIYSPHVSIFKKEERERCALMEQPVQVAIVSFAAYDLRKEDYSGDRTALGLKDTEITEATLTNCLAYVNGMKAKIRNMLRIMAQKEHKHLVLGAPGCGAFCNLPTVVANFFKSVFQEKEFQGRFESVTFAILGRQDGKSANTVAFTALCQELNTQPTAQA